MELNRLTEAGLLLSEDEGKTKVYRANHSHPFFAEITGMVSKFLGLEDLMEKIVKRMGNVEKAIIVGDYARGVDSGIVELVLIGQDLDRAYLDFIAGKAYEKLKRKVQVTLLEEDPGNIQGIMVFGR